MTMFNEKEKTRFNDLCRKMAAEDLSGSGIGTMSEKRMHKTFKHFVCDDDSCHEVRIRPDGSAVISESTPQRISETGRGGFIADVFSNGDIIEIQTGGFYPMKKKLEFYLQNTDFRVTVLHPLVGIKWTVWIDPETGETTKRRRSPKKENLQSLLPELFWISEHLRSERLYFRIPVIEAEEYKMLDGYGKDKKKRATKYERFPISLINDVTYRADEICEALFPTELTGEFTSSDFTKATGLRGRKLSSALKLLCLCSVIEKCGKRGRSFIYMKKT